MTKENARRYVIIKNLIAKKIDGTEAAQSLGLSVRQTKRLKKRVVKYGIKGIIHSNRGKVSHNKIKTSRLNKVIKLLHKIYHDFNPLLAQEHLRDDDHITLSKETVRKIMIMEKLWQPRRKSYLPKFSWRERMDNYGQMMQFDGSYHDWFEGRNEAVVGSEQCLLVSVDDATGRITKARFEYNEGVIPVLRFWQEYFKVHGRPLSIYLDKFSTYKVNHKNAVDNKDLMTKFERAMKQLDVKVIHAHTPQAKGRVEKMNHTLQRRLVKEMRLAKINTIMEANKYLEEIFIPKFNQQFAVQPKKEANLHQPLNKQQLLELDGIMSVQSDRIINNDYTVRLDNKYFQLNEIQPITVYKKDKVKIEERLDGKLKISLRGKYLDYQELPERPKKMIDIKLPALTIKKSTAHIPPANHPWRHRFYNKKSTNTYADKTG